MKKVIRILIIVALAFILKFYLFDLPRQMYKLKEYIKIQAEVDSLQTKYINQLVKNNNAFVDYLKRNNETTAQ